MGIRRAPLSSAIEDDVAVANYADNTLERLALFLEYAELPESARQVGNIRNILWNIMQTEQLRKLALGNERLNAQDRRLAAVESPELKMPDWPIS